MYRQVLVHPADRDFQRVLWRATRTEPVSEYRLNTVTYGLSCSPFLAMRTLRQLASNEGERFPTGAVALRNDCYVDDVVTGASTLREAITLQQELRELCTAGGFPLRKWAANNPRILGGIPREHCGATEPHLWQAEQHATLGLTWHPAHDHFTFRITRSTLAETTKRRVLAETARLFDPLGWLAPVVVRAKILIQSAWLLQLGWDTPLPPAEAQLWRAFLEDLPSLEGLRVNRWLGSDRGSQALEIHGFADASERGYAAVVYLRTSERHSHSIALIAAKSKVAPVKTVSLPRLELCAATLLAGLARHYRAELSLEHVPVHPWTDSTVTLHWIQSHPSRWKTYVANRVTQIQARAPDARWLHVSGKDNPADCASRGIAPSELLHHPLWWSGLAWLSQDRVHWPAQSDVTPAETIPEVRVSSSLVTRHSVKEPDMLTRFSSLNRLLRVTAWCLRWRPAGRRVIQQEEELPPPLQPQEMDDSLLRWLLVQRAHYSAEISALQSNRSVSSRSGLSSLRPFLDDRHLLRVGGRLKHAWLTMEERHPLILPPSSWLSKLMVLSCHWKTLHGGVQLTLGLLRQRFWLPRGRTIAKQTLHRCTPCVRWRAASPQPAMGSLPQGRVTPARPFLRTGVDYAGPILVRTSKGRGQRAHKAFIAVFVCFSTKAVHLEVVSDYTTEAFLAAFRRFTSRRGLCEEIYSDCGTNFIGADRALRQLLRASSSDGRRIADEVAAHGVRWRFNPPAAPHFGGLWEAVKSAKHHLRRVVGEHKLTYEELSTLLAQIEACLNSRPLHALSDDPADVTALTPGHFLIGAPLLAVPAPSHSDEADHLSNRWQLTQKMRDHFWQRWATEYLHTLSARSKWHRQDTSTPQIGQLCLVRAELTPPNRWPLARITELHPGDDGNLRVATIRTATREYKRPLVKLVLLPGAAPDTAL